MKKINELLTIGILIVGTVVFILFSCDKGGAPFPVDSPVQWS